MNNTHTMSELDYIAITGDIRTVDDIDNVDFCDDSSYNTCELSDGQINKHNEQYGK